MPQHRLHLQNISITNFAVSWINTTAEMWKHFCRCCSVTAVREQHQVTDSAEMLLAEPASKQGCFISLHTLSWVYSLRNPPRGTLVAEQNHCQKVSASCSANVISAPFPLFLSWLLWVFVYVLLLSLREGFFFSLWWKHGFWFLRGSWV